MNRLSTRIFSFAAAVILLAAMLPLFSVSAADNYSVAYNKTIIECNTNETVILIASHTIPSKATDVKYQWYVSSTTKLTEAQKIEGANSARYSPGTDIPGTFYFYCEVTANYNGETVTTLNYSNMSAVKVVLKAPLKLVPIGEDNVTVYSPTQVIFFKAKAENASSPSYSWYVCDEKGTTSGPLISIGDTLAVNGISSSKLGVPQYFACIATDTNGMDFHIFSCVLEDESKRPSDDEKDDADEETTEPEDPAENDEPKDDEKPKLPFTDVAETDWFYNDVYNAYTKGLVNGKEAELYCPNDNMTYAEAVKLACVIHQLDRDGKITIPNGSTFWYSTYMDYALDKGIIEEDLSKKANEKITRKEYVYIFYKALPEENFVEINNINAGSIPDVEAGKYSHRIYSFYRAGILTGSDEAGSFNPDSNIKRSEVAAILTRMLDADARKNITLK